MSRVALKGLAGRKVRALLTALAIVIGVSMVSGTFILTDTMRKSFDGIFTASYEGTDAVIQGKEIVKGVPTGVTVDAKLADKVAKLDEVGAVGGSVFPPDGHAAEILGDDGKAVARESVATSYDAKHSQFSPLRLKKGRWPEGEREVVVDAGTAKNEHYEVGDQVVIRTQGQKRAYTVTGTASYGEVDKLGFASIAVWDLPTAQKLLDREGRFDQISIAAKKGVAPSAVVTAVQPLLAGNLEVKDANAQADEASEELDESLAQMRTFLLAFGFIALFVGAFVIFNTLSITVAQRTREFATLRTIGASRKQVLRSVIIEGFVIGLVASAIGLVAGFGIAKGMIALFSALGLELPESETVLASRTVIVSLLLGTSITLIASIAPARRSTRVPPIAAVREGAELPKSGLETRSRGLGLGLLAISLAAIVAAMLGSGPMGLLLGGGAFGLFAAIALLAPRLVKPIASVVGWPARRLGGVAGDLAGANSIRNPSRTASSAAALMIGLTLITLVAVLGAGMRSAVESAVADQVNAAYVVDGKDGMAFRATEGEELAALPGVEGATHVRSDKAVVKGKDKSVSGIDPETIGRFYNFEWLSGSEKALEQMGRDGAVVNDSYAKDNHLTLGSSLKLKTPSGNELTVVVRGIYDKPRMKQLLAPISISQTAFDKSFAEPKNSYTFLDASAGAGPSIEAAVEDFGDATYHTAAAFPKDATKEIKTLLAMLYVLLGFSVIVSLFGMVNTMVLSVFERTREIGMLRTIGMTRRQARRMIRHESVITALIGAALGLSLGVFLSGAITKAGSDWGLEFALPLGTLVAFTLVAVLAGIGAAIAPARRASRLDVLGALKYE